MARRKWTDNDVARAVRSTARDGVMPTVAQMDRRTGSAALSNQVCRRGGVDAWADRLGLSRSQHASRKGWKWEAWFAEEAAKRGLNVQPRSRKKSPHDVLVNGVDVDVKVANGAHQLGATQWTWRICTPYPCSAYAFVGLEEGKPSFVLIAPKGEVPATCATARRSSVNGLLGRWEPWRDAWHVLDAA